jgi:hypothetical protein
VAAVALSDWAGGASNDTDCKRFFSSSASISSASLQAFDDAYSVPRPRPSPHPSGVPALHNSFLFLGIDFLSFKFKNFVFFINNSKFFIQKIKIMV